MGDRTTHMVPYFLLNKFLCSSVELITRNLSKQYMILQTINEKSLDIYYIILMHLNKILIDSI